MCGRVTLTLDKQMVMEILNDVFQVNNQVDLSEPNYNIGPSQKLLSVIEHKGERRAGYINFGTTPTWNTSQKKSLIINARSETIDSKPMFQSSFEHRRCIILADSFYEWKKGTNKRTFRFRVNNQKMISLAGIYMTKREPNSMVSHGAVILTCEANGLMKPIHHRMPVILNGEGVDQWLNPNSNKDVLKSLCQPYASDSMNFYEVSSYVNSLLHNDERCIEKIGV